MRRTFNTWAVVLAGGSGPQSTELAEATARAQAICAPQHVCSVVSDRHHVWWKRSLRGYAGANTFVQPANRGSGYGVLLALLRLEMSAPDAIVVFIPADHYVADEAALARSLRVMANLASEQVDDIFLLGVTPEGADSERGYIVPTTVPHGTAAPIRAFIEKPAQTLARELISQGALWNTCIVGGFLPALLRLFESRCPDQVLGMRRILRRIDARGTRLKRFYAKLDLLDFSQDILADPSHRLHVLSAPSGVLDLSAPLRPCPVEV